jgi:hypothetical protein
MPIPEHLIEFERIVKSSIYIREGSSRFRERSLLHWRHYLFEIQLAFNLFIEGAKHHKRTWKESN